MCVSIFADAVSSLAGGWLVLASRNLKPMNRMKAKVNTCMNACTMPWSKIEEKPVNEIAQ